MGVKDYLLSGEDVVASCRSAGWYWMATTNRVVKYRSTQYEEMMHDVSYEDVTGVTIEHEYETWRLAAGVLIVLLGVALLAFEPLLSPPLVLVGLYVAYTYVSTKRSWFRLHVRDGGPETDDQWIIEDVEDDETRELVDVIEDRIS